MRTSKLRQSGGAIIVTLPKAYLDQIGLKANAPVDIDVVDGRIVISPQQPGRIGLAARLAQCDFDAPVSDDERAWIEGRPVGEEVI